MRLQSNRKGIKKGRPSKIVQVLPQLKKLGIFHVWDAKKLGISRPSLSRLVTEEKVIRLGTGLYAHPDFKIPPEDRDYIIACSKFGPKSVIGGMTALFHFGLIEQIPQRVWVLVPYTQKTSDPLYRCIRTKSDSRKGVEVHDNYRITNLERTIVEAFRYSTKIGLRIAFHAARVAIDQKRTTLSKIYKQARELGLEKFLDRHWEALVPEGQVE